MRSATYNSGSQRLSDELIVAVRSSGLTQKEIAAQVDVHASNLCHYLAGRPVPRTADKTLAIYKVADFVNVPRERAFVAEARQ